MINEYSRLYSRSEWISNTVTFQHDASASNYWKIYLNSLPVHGKLIPRRYFSEHGTETV